MKLKSLLLALVLSLSACRYDEVVNSEEYPNSLLKYIDIIDIDPQLMPSMAEFLANCERFGSWARDRCKYNVEFLMSVKQLDELDLPADERKTVVGLCVVYEDGSTKIEIKNTIDPDSMLMRGLMMHEAGHCLLGYGHASEGSERIMEPFLLPERTYLQEWAGLIADLFTRDVPQLDENKGVRTRCVARLNSDGSVSYENN